MSDKPQAAEEQGGTSTVRVDSELVRMARIVCAHTTARPGKQTKLVDYLDSLLRKQITDDYNRVIAEVADLQKKEKKPKQS